MYKNLLVGDFSGEGEANDDFVLIVEEGELDGERDLGVGLENRHAQLIGDFIAGFQRALGVSQGAAGVLLGEWVVNGCAQDCGTDAGFQGLGVFGCKFVKRYDYNF